MPTSRTIEPLIAAPIGFWYGVHMSDSKSSFRMGLVMHYASEAVPPVTFRFPSVAPARTANMDAFVKHIHGNESFSLDSVAKAVDEAFKKSGLKI